jgi:Flp pilus assembly protein TadG
MANRLRKAIGRICGDRRGNFAVMTAAVASTLAPGVGFGVNTAQMFHVRSNLLNALDSAVTSTARDLTTGKIAEKDARAMVEAFLLSNGSVQFTRQDTITLDTLVVDKTANVVSARAHVDVDMLFPLFGMENHKRIAVESAALYSDRHIEVAMMLDITGSMAGQKIKDLKTAANAALDAFLGGQDPAKPRVRVSIVPYADAVNAGSLANMVHVETGYTTGEPPKLDAPMAVATAPDSCATERKGSQQFTDASPTKAKVNRDYRLDFCPASALVPLSADIAALKKTVKGFAANGYTGGHTGIQWSWYMLSPKWRDVLPKAADPANFDPKKTAKIAVLMTDGEFNTAFAGVAKGENTHGQSNLSRNNAEKLCAAMRKDGIEIFTVGFMLKEAGAKGVMKNCASTDSGPVKHYFEASTGAELSEAFLEIARNVERLAVTK